MSYLHSLKPDAGLLQIFQAFPEIARPLLEYHEVLLRGICRVTNSANRLRS